MTAFAFSGRKRKTPSRRPRGRQGFSFNRPSPVFVRKQAVRKRLRAARLLRVPFSAKSARCFTLGRVLQNQTECKIASARQMTKHLRHVLQSRDHFRNQLSASYVSRRRASLGSGGVGKDAANHFQLSPGPRNRRKSRNAAFQTLWGRVRARSQLQGHGFDQNRCAAGPGDVFCPRACQRLRGGRVAGRTRASKWPKNKGFSTLSQSAEERNESDNKNDCPCVTARRTIVYRFRTFARVKMRYGALLRVLPDCSFAKIIDPGRAELGLPAAPRRCFRQLPPASPDASRSLPVRNHRWFGLHVPGRLVRAPLPSLREIGSVFVVFRSCSGWFGHGLVMLRGARFVGDSGPTRKLARVLELSRQALASVIWP